jgi:general secretion pathway protein C
MATWLAFVVWAAVAASAVFWGWKLIPPTAPAPAVVATPLAAPLGDLSRLLGAPPTPKQGVVMSVSDRSRFQLIGVIAASDPRSAGNGFALITVDGQRAKAYRVGDMLDSDWALRAVHMRRVSIARRNGDAAISLELPPRSLTTGGQLSAAGLSDAQALAHVNPPNPVPVATLRPTPTGGGAPQDRAPNTLLNNPADMAPADVGGQESQTRR